MNFYLTTPLYYVNAKPHIGSAYTTIISDAICRFQQLQGDREVCLLTGVDEHGGKIENTAKGLGISPQIHCDQISAEFRHLWQRLQINYQKFSRTSSHHHKQFVEEFWRRVQEKGDIYEGEYKGLYCLACEDFKTDKEITEDNLCLIHKTPVQEYSEKNYFFALSKYTQQISSFLEENPHFITPSYRAHEVKAWLDQGLRDFPISRRSVNWGIPVPGDPSQTIYVWFDALLGYLSPLLEDSRNISRLENFKGYTHIIGKDILRFHGVYWLAMLMSADLPLPRRLFGHGFLTKDGQKMGKSTGNIIDPDELIDTFGVDAVRFYFMFNIPFGADGDYTEGVFIEVVNAYLANRLGNLFSRVLKLSSKYLDLSISKEIPLHSEISPQAISLADKVKTHMEILQPHEALKEIFDFVDLLNLQLNEHKPWNLLKSDSPDQKTAGEELLLVVLESLRIVASLLCPFTPGLGQKMLQVFAQDKPGNWNDLKRWGVLQKGEKLIDQGILFARIER